ncbi:hypothetical protein, partial [Enterobacter hormaechei]
MSTTLKEWLVKTITELEEERDAVPGAVNEDAAMALAAMKLALASLEANGTLANEGTITATQFKPVADLYEVTVPSGRSTTFTKDAAEASDCRVMGWSVQEYVKLERYQAAMLQGAEPVTTAYKLPFEQWLSQQTGTIDVECGCVMTEVFFHWLRVAYEAANSSVIPDGVCPCCGRKPLKNRTCSVSGCDGKHVARGFCIKHYAIERKKDPSRRESIRAADKRYRARKAAAPQQEISHALAKGM